MTDVSLFFKAESDEIVTADKRLDHLNETGKQTEKVIGSTGGAFKKTEKDISGFGDGVKKVDNKTSSFKAEIDKMTASLDREAAIIGKTKNQIELYDASTRGATQQDLAAIKVLQQKRDSLRSLNAISKTVTTNAGSLGQAFGKSNHKVQNTAFQLQDIVVQLEQGTSVSRTFGQQLPQLLGGFGAVGAISGVVAGLAFALGGVLVSSMDSSVDAAKSLEKALEGLDSVISVSDLGVVELSDKFQRLSEIGGVAFAAQLKEGISDAKDAIKAASDEAKNLANDLSPNELGGKFDLTTLRVSILRNEFNEGKITLQEFSAGLNEVSLKSTPLTKDFRDLRQSISETAEQSASAFARLEELRRVEEGNITTVNEHQKSIDRLIDSLFIQSQAANDAANSTSFYRAQQLGATEAELGRIQSLQGLIDAQKEQAKQQAEADKLSDAIAKEENAKAASFEVSLSRLEDSLRTEEERIRDSYSERNRIISAALAKDLLTESEAGELRARINEEETVRRVSGATDLFGQLSTLASSESKELFEIGKAASLANATIKGVESAINAYQFGSSIGGPVLGGAFAAASALATGTLLAQINSQQAPGRALGGQVRPGESYRVGEFGPETITLGSNGGTITPNAANDSAPIEVVNNISVVGGNSNPRVTSTSNRISDKKIVTDIVVDLMANQSSPARQALHSTSNVQPRGSR